MQQQAGWPVMHRPKLAGDHGSMRATLCSRAGLGRALDRNRTWAHLSRNYHYEGPMSENTKPVTDQSFQTDVLEASKTGPVLVDFWAEWCGPCKMIGPALEEIADELAGKLTVAKVDIDNNPMSPNNYAVRGIPTLILFKDGKPKATQVGALPKSRLREWISGNI
jgi:thioredoxin 1